MKSLHRGSFFLSSWVSVGVVGGIAFLQAVAPAGSSSPVWSHIASQAYGYVLLNESGNSAPPALQADLVVGCVEEVYSRPVNLKANTSPRENMAPECPPEEMFRRVSIDQSGKEFLDPYQGQLVFPATTHDISYVGAHVFE